MNRISLLSMALSLFVTFAYADEKTEPAAEATQDATATETPAVTEEAASTETTVATEDAKPAEETTSTDTVTEEPKAEEPVQTDSAADVKTEEAALTNVEPVVQEEQKAEKPKKKAKRASSSKKSKERKDLSDEMNKTKEPLPNPVAEGETTEKVTDLEEKKSDKVVIKGINREQYFNNNS